MGKNSDDQPSQSMRVRAWYVVFYCVVWFVSHLFFRFRVTGLEYVPAGASVICANHSSNWDIIFLTVALGAKKPLVFTPKTSLKKVPVLGVAMNLINVVWIDRAKPADAAPVRAMLDALKNGYPVVMFPEGRRLKESETEAAKTGAIMLASRSGAPIVPVHIPRTKRFFTRQLIQFGEAYALDNIRGADARRNAADALMARINMHSEN